MDADRPDGPQLGPLHQVPHPAGLLRDRSDDPRQSQEVERALAQDARDPAAHRHRARGGEPARAPGPVEERARRAREARHQDALAVAASLEEVRRRRARREPRAHEGAHGEGGRHGELRQSSAALHTGVIKQTYDAVLYGMAWVAGSLMAAMMVTSCIDVGLRSPGYPGTAPFFTFTEYALLAVPCLGAPWLVREKGHIFVEIFLMALKPRWRAMAVRLIGVVCVVVCAVLAWYGSVVTISDFVQ